MQWGIQRARRALAAAPAEARVGLGIETLSVQSAAQKLFEDHGFKLVRHILRMTIELEAAPEDAVWPEGITVHGMRRGQDERRVIQAFRESFSDHWGYVETPFEDTFERWMNYIDDNPDFDADLWFIAEENGVIAGISLCWEKSFGDPNLGWVGTLGVLRPWRRRGLGMALLHHSFARLYERGQRKVGLGVDAQSLTGATRLYEKAGMHSDLQHQMSVFELELRPGIDFSTQAVEA
jgi:ribosomal protein S18 acetylase RimI-like enzyme